MLLSIVECSDHKKFSGFGQALDGRRNLSSAIELIGPVSGPNVSSMRNRGAKQARGKWIFFKDEDCHLHLPQIIELIEKLEKGSASPAAIGGIYRSAGSGIWAKAYHRIQRQWVLSGLKKMSPQTLPSGRHLLGGAFLVRKSAFSEVGGFSEQIGWGGEETEFVQRLRNSGFRTAVSYRVIVEHRNSLSMLGFIKRAWHQNFNKSFYEIGPKNPVFTNKWFYIRTPLAQWPTTVLFFGTAFLGSLFGRFLKLLSGLGVLWKS